MEKVKVISYSRDNMVEVVVRKPDGKRKDGTQKYSSKTMHIPKNRLKDIE